MNNAIFQGRPLKRQRYVIEGIVQGVGFRPFVYQLADRLCLNGWVRNDSRGVTIEVEGSVESLHDFGVSLQKEKPPLAVITNLVSQEIPLENAKSFLISSSGKDLASRVQIAPDSFVCDDCLNELFDPTDRRYLYPFINCTNCGPRYTIVTGIPYDRPLTTMAEFTMCPECLAEYENPRSRRFHAQPNACFKCGPQLSLLDSKGQLMTDDPLTAALNALQQGKIVAIKGIGGYHLAVDATNDDAVLTLRRRKERDEKPFAVMSRDLVAVREFSEVNDDEERLLSTAECPIVLLKKSARPILAEAIAPGNKYFGVMLPYTPLHHLLLSGNLATLVMTSANRTDDPIAYRDSEALNRLATIADMFLVNNRRIETRTEDSIVRMIADKAMITRRSRGFVPRRLMLPTVQKSVLAVGAELKNTVCLTRGENAFLSQHIGDLKNLDVYDAFKQTITHLKHILETEPVSVAHDLHPDYYSSRYARSESSLPCIAVQHHHAHLASCLAEHCVGERVIGVCFDGAGYGSDGHIWGGEFLLGDVKEYQRVGHFRYLPMPGGDLATASPWRMALSCLQDLYSDIPAKNVALRGIPEADWRLVAQATEKGLNAPLTSSCGRLFDAVSALIGLRQHVTFEGQAAIELEMRADPDQKMVYPYELIDDSGQVLFDSRPMLGKIIDEHQAGTTTAAISGRFHATLADMVTTICDHLRTQSGLHTVVLSGGVFQNALLTLLTKGLLTRAGFNVLTHSLVPPNDGGLALGQAVIAGSHLG